ncbi:MAG: hypothetical protein ABL974_23510 [Prosthecobacter sp.]
MRVDGARPRHYNRFMPTYNTKAKVTRNHELEVRLPTELAEGEYSVFIQVNHQLLPCVPRAPLTFGSLHLGALSGETFRREDIYGDDGR